MTEYPIWRPESGITDLEADPAELGTSEIPGIRAVWTDQRARLKDSVQLREFTERLCREWAIETGVIENLYEIERGVTRTLIERGFQAELLTHGATNKNREYVLDLLRDQQDALEGVFDFVKSQRELSTSWIRELHAALLRSQDTTEGLDTQGRHVEIPLLKGDWKTQSNHPVRDGITYIYCPPEQVGSEMDRLVEMHANHRAKDVPGEVQAAWLHHRFTQIHPFQDGNGRVARAITSLVLIKDGLFPLVVTRDDKPEYLDCLEAADKGDLKPLVTLITRLQVVQYRKASAISESVLVEESVSAALGDLHRAADKVAGDRLASLRGVFDLAQILEENLDKRLDAISDDVKAALERVSDGATVYTRRSGPGTDYYYRSQILENAREHVDYYADTREYRSWVSLDMRWSRGCKLVFAIHGIGTQFNGSLVCAPFLEFRDTDEEGQRRATLTPVARDGFIFFYNEDREKLLSRFKPWREEVLMVAIRELTRNL